MLRKKTVAGVMTVFTKTIADLRKIHADNIAKADDAQESMDALEDMQNGYLTEAKLAFKHADNIENMLNG